MIDQYIESLRSKYIGELCIITDVGSGYLTLFHPTQWKSATPLYRMTVGDPFVVCDILKYIVPGLSDRLVLKILVEGRLFSTCYFRINDEIDDTTCYVEKVIKIF